MLRAGSFILSLWLFYFIDHGFHLHFKLRHYLYVLAILCFGILLSPFYYLYPNYDKLLHLLMPILISIMVFFAVNKLDIKFQWKLLLTVTTVVSFLAIFEIIEYIIDLVLDLNLQGVYLRDVSGMEKFNLILDRNDDTMIDLILGVIGAIIFTSGKTICYFYNKRHQIKKIRLCF